MKQSQFFIQLSLISIAIAFLFYILHQQFASVAQYQDFSWICLGTFIVLSIILFFVGKQKSLNPNPNAFTQLMLSVTFGKMFLAVALVFIYHKTALPQDSSFLIPFFIVYLVYTIYEVYFMTKLGKPVDS